MRVAYPSEATAAVVVEHSPERLTATRLIVVSYHQQLSAGLSEQELLVVLCVVKFIEL